MSKAAFELWRAAYLAAYEAAFLPFAACLRLAGPVVVRVLPDVPDHCDQCRHERIEKEKTR